MRMRSVLCGAVCMWLVGSSAGFAEATMPDLSALEDEVDIKPARAPAARPTPVRESGGGGFAAAGGDAADVLPDLGSSEDEVRAALTAGVSYLRSLAEKDPDGWIYPPIHHRKVVDYRESEPQYYSQRTVEVTVPIYEYTTKTVEEFRNVRQGNSVDAVTVRKKVKVHKRIRGKQIGTKKEKRTQTYPDKNGTIRRVHRIPIYGPGGPDEWNLYQFGHNAMAVFAMVEAGVEPSDPVVVRVIDNLANIYDRYGLPDTTWDLVWSVAAFSMRQPDWCKRRAERMAGKLLDGQLQSGQATGLWGPLSINRELLGAMLDKQQQYSRLYMKAQEKLAQEKQNSKKRRVSEKKMLTYERAVDAAHEALLSSHQLINQVGMGISMTGRPEQYISKSDEVGAVNPIRLSGYPEHYFSQASADIESTSLAMFGISIAARQKTLPMETWRPKDARKNPIMPPRHAADVLRGAMMAVSKYQNKEGTWCELNALQPVTAFDQYEAVPGVPANAETFPRLPSKTTDTSTAQGYSVFAAVAEMRGVNALLPCKSSVANGNKALQGVLKKKIKEITGGNVSPYEFCFALRSLPDLGEAGFELNVTEPVTSYLVSEQLVNGAWGPEKPARGRVPLLFSSHRERLEVLPAMVPGNQENPVELNDAHVYTKRKTGNHSIVNWYGFDPNITCTAYAMLTLAAGLDDAEGASEGE